MLTMRISIASLLVSLAALGVALLNRWYGEHFSAAVSCRKIVELDGQECDHYSLSA